MVDGIGGRPDDIVMAVFADVGRQDMRDAFAGRLDAVVATHTVARNIYMIEIGRSPGNCRVAVVAIVTASDVIGGLPRRRRAIVA